MSHVIIKTTRLKPVLIQIWRSKTLWTLFLTTTKSFLDCRTQIVCFFDTFEPLLVVFHIAFGARVHTHTHTRVIITSKYSLPNVCKE